MERKRGERSHGGVKRVSGTPRDCKSETAYLSIARSSVQDFGGEPRQKRAPPQVGAEEKICSLTWEICSPFGSTSAPAKNLPPVFLPQRWALSLSSGARQRLYIFSTLSNTFQNSIPSLSAPPQTLSTPSLRDVAALRRWLGHVRTWPGHVFSGLPISSCPFGSTSAPAKNLPPVFLPQRWALSLSSGARQRLYIFSTLSNTFQNSIPSLSAPPQTLSTPSLRDVAALRRWLGHVRTWPGHVFSGLPISSW
ncbi:hypothetical protein BJ138DRAFT_1118866 [Hygrophoropsis aurantiaca]|uniref:Uncharacterized protein n=1 Tax=Hygrophoropsis aurantiaca TaxID=72124 RepID=A0ACB7ZWD9_9AGAM|nr:hypothetical protein BJ138DRAFT_1118866 [Hygrophoropsis aurantiaca]